jgi:hypothetical protein
MSVLVKVGHQYFSTCAMCDDEIGFLEVAHARRADRKVQRDAFAYLKMRSVAHQGSNSINRAHAAVVSHVT